MLILRGIKLLTCSTLTHFILIKEANNMANIYLKFPTTIQICRYNIKIFKKINNFCYHNAPSFLRVLITPCIYLSPSKFGSLIPINCARYVIMFSLFA